MNDVDISYQLSQVHWMQFWICNHKCQNSTFLWGINVFIVNDYVCYRSHCDFELKKPEWLYPEFLKACLLACIDSEKYWPEKGSQLINNYQFLLPTISFKYFIFKGNITSVGNARIIQGWMINDWWEVWQPEILSVHKYASPVSPC